MSIANGRAIRRGKLKNKPVEASNKKKPIIADWFFVQSTFSGFCMASLILCSKACSATRLPCSVSCCVSWGGKWVLGRGVNLSHPITNPNAKPNSTKKVRRDFTVVPIFSAERNKCLSNVKIFYQNFAPKPSKNNHRYKSPKNLHKI